MKGEGRTSFKSWGNSALLRGELITECPSCAFTPTPNDLCGIGQHIIGFMNYERNLRRDNIGAIAIECPSCYCKFFFHIEVSTLSHLMLYSTCCKDVYYKHGAATEMIKKMYEFYVEEPNKTKPYRCKTCRIRLNEIESFVVQYPIHGVDPDTPVEQCAITEHYCLAHKPSDESMMIKQTLINERSLK